LAVESLEPRVLLVSQWIIMAELAGDLVNITFNESGTSIGDDTLTLLLDASGHLAYEFSPRVPIPADPWVDYPISQIGSVTVNAAGGSDRLVLDFTNGSPVPTDGIDFSGGGGTGDADAIELIAYDVASLDVVHRGTDSATLRVDGGPAISYAQTELLHLGGPARDLLIDLSQTGLPDPDIVFGRDVSGPSESYISGSTFALTRFDRPGSSLTIDVQAPGVGQADSISIEDLAADPGDLTIHGDNQDAVHFRSPLTTGNYGQNLNVTAGTIDFHVGVIVPETTILNASDDITIHAAGYLLGGPGGGLQITAGGDVVADGDLWAGWGPLSVNAGGDVLADGDLWAIRGPVSVNAGDDFVQNGDVTGTAVFLSASNDTPDWTNGIVMQPGSAISSGGGDIRLETPGGSIVLENAARVETGGGALSLDAGVAITMANGSVVDAGGGTVDLTADYGVLLSRVVSPGATVMIDAGQGGIADGADPADPPDPDGADIEADRAVLSAGGSIGTRIENTPLGTVVVRLDTKINHLVAESGGVGIFLVNEGPLDSVAAEVNRTGPPPGIVDVTANSEAGVFLYEAESQVNPSDRFDLNGDGAATPLDALLVINWVNNPDHDSKVPDHLDLNDDGLGTPLDVLLVINRLNEPDPRERSLAAIENDDDKDKLLDEELLALLF
jgi:hypothetical protein